MITPIQQRTIILGRIIGSMLSTYQPHEKTKTHKELELRILKGLKQQIKKWGKKDVFATVALGKEVWYESIDHFEANNITIEASNLVLRVLNEDEKNLGKAYGLNKGIIGRWAKPMRRPDAAELEQKTGEVVRHLLSLVNSKLGIEEVKKPSVLNRIRWAKHETK